MKRPAPLWIVGGAVSLLAGLAISGVARGSALEPRSQGMGGTGSAVWGDAGTVFSNPAALATSLENSLVVVADGAGDNNAMTLFQAIGLLGSHPENVPMSPFPAEGASGQWDVAGGLAFAYGSTAISAQFDGSREYRGLSEEALLYVMSGKPLASGTPHSLHGTSQSAVTLDYGLSYGREIPLATDQYRLLVGSTIRVERGKSLSEYSFNIDGFTVDPASGTASWTPGHNYVTHLQSDDAAGWGLDAGAVLLAPHGWILSFLAENLWSETRWFDAHAWSDCFEASSSGGQLCEEPVAPLPTQIPGSTTTPFPRPSPQCLCLQSLGNLPSGNPVPEQNCLTDPHCPSVTLRQLHRPVLRNEIAWRNPAWAAFQGIFAVGLDADTGERGFEDLPRHKQYQFRVGVQTGWRKLRFRAGYSSRYGYYDLLPEQHEGGDLHAGIGVESPGSSTVLAISTDEKLRFDPRQPMLSLEFVGRF